jgi:hypothetical protein
MVFAADPDHEGTHPRGPTARHFACAKRRLDRPTLIQSIVHQVAPLTGPGFSLDMGWGGAERLAL